MTHEPLRGSCSCGRNQYQIQIPEDVTNHAEVYFDSSRDNRMWIPFSGRLFLTNSGIQVNSMAHLSQHGCGYRWTGINHTPNHSSQMKPIL